MQIRQHWYVVFYPLDGKNPNCQQQTLWQAGIKYSHILLLRLQNGKIPTEENLAVM